MYLATSCKTNYFCVWLSRVLTTGSETSNLTFYSCIMRNVSQCDITENSPNFVVTIYNTLSSSVTQFVRLPVLGDAYSVKTADGEFKNNKIYEKINSEHRFRFQFQQVNINYKFIFFKCTIVNINLITKKFCFLIHQKHFSVNFFLGIYILKYYELYTIFHSHP